MALDNSILFQDSIPKCAGVWRNIVHKAIFYSIYKDFSLLGTFLSLWYQKQVALQSLTLGGSIPGLRLGQSSPGEPLLWRWTPQAISTWCHSASRSFQPAAQAQIPPSCTGRMSCSGYHKSLSRSSSRCH